MPNFASSNALVLTVEGIIDVPQEDSNDDASAVSGSRVLERAGLPPRGHPRCAEPGDRRRPIMPA
jgi:hypothetical protein